MSVRTAIHGHGERASRTGRVLLERVEASSTVVAYWLAIGLPMVYLPVLFTGLESLTELGMVIGLLMLHGVALIGGRNYHPGSDGK